MSPKSLYVYGCIVYPTLEQTYLYCCCTVSIVVYSNTAMHDLSKKITTATMELYHSIVKDLPPTPSKFHYIFNLRDLSRIYHGLCLTTPDRFDSVASFIRVWRNECMRVFFDRLTNDKDREIVSVSVSIVVSYCIIS